MVGTKELDRFLFQSHIDNEFDDSPLDEDFEMPKLRPSKISYFDLKKKGKVHPMADKIMAWQFKMEQEGRYDEIPDDPEIVIKMFEEGRI